MPASIGDWEVLGSIGPPWGVAHRLVLSAKLGGFGLKFPVALWRYGLAGESMGVTQWGDPVG